MKCKTTFDGLLSWLQGYLLLQGYQRWQVRADDFRIGDGFTEGISYDYAGSIIGITVKQVTLDTVEVDGLIYHAAPGDTAAAERHLQATLAAIELQFSDELTRQPQDAAERREVVKKLWIAGQSDSEIAIYLNCSASTIKRDREKMGLRSKPKREK